MASLLSRMTRTSMYERLPVPQLNSKIGANKAEFTPRTAVQSTPEIAIAMASTFTSTVKSREEYNREFDKIKTHYLTDALLTNITEDALTPDISSGKILRITTKRDDIRDDLEKFQDNFNLDGIIDGFVPDLLTYGEHSLRLVIEEGKGVTDIVDDVDTGSLVAFYKQGYPFKFLIKDGKTLSLKDPVDYAHFMLSGRKLGVKVFDKLTPYQLDKLPPAIRELPTHIRVGKPIFYSVISKIKELDLLEKIVPALRISDLTSQSIVGLSMPAMTDPKEAFNACRDYETLFNRKVTLTDSGQLTATDILQQAGMIKVVPTYGDKGLMQNFDVKTSNSTTDVMNNIRDTRDIICSSIGFPTELLYGGASQSEMIKKYARYFRKLKAIQSCIAEGVLQIAMAHLQNLSDKTRSIKLTDLEVEFLNETVNVDELEKLEYVDTKAGLVSNQIDLLVKLTETGYGDIIDKDTVRKWLSDNVDWIDFEAKEHATKKPSPSVQVDDTNATNSLDNNSTVPNYTTTNNATSNTTLNSGSAV